MKEKPYILVVDDDPNIAKLEQLYLEKAGYEVKTVGRGDDAMTEFRKMPPDLMLLDVMMPGMDGWQVLKAVRKSSNIPIIMVTARDETFDKVLGLELGADDYITKPFDSKEMAARVKAVLRRTMGQTEEEEESNDDTLSFPRTDGQFEPLRSVLRGQEAGDAAEGAGSAVLPCQPRQPAVHAWSAA